MKTHTLLATFALQIWAVAAEVSDSKSSCSRLNAIEQWMKKANRWADDMVLEELGGLDGLIMIKSEGKLVGYYYEEYDWEREDLKSLDLTGITRVTYGQPGPRDLDYTPIEFTEATEIALWVAAYKNHTQRQSGHAFFVPVSPRAGFAFAREELDYGGIYLSGGLGVRFYSVDKEVLCVRGPLHEVASMSWRTRNRPLHLLVKARMPKKKTEEESYDPFSDPAGAPVTGAEQDGAEQPATAPESKPEGDEKPKPESEKRSQ